MKKIYMLMVIAIVGIGSCLAPVSATENIINLGTIEYSDIGEQTLIVKINSTETIELIYISSDINESALYVFSHFFLISENVTRYVFATSQITVDWQFINDTKTFIYQDASSLQLYSVNINYTAIHTPPDPFIEWMEKYDNLTYSSDNLTILLNTTLNELNASKNELKDRWNTFNQSQETFDNNTIAMGTMGIELHDLNIEYNTTEALWLSATTNASTFETNWLTLGAKHNKLQEEHDNLNGRYPIYVIFAILGTAIITTLFLKRKKIFGHGDEESSARKNEIETGYGNNAEKIDKFSSVKFVKKVAEKLTPKQRRKDQDVIPEVKPTELDDKTIKELTEILKAMKTKVNTKTEE